MGSYEAARKTSKKVINFFVVGLTYGWRKSWKRILRKPFSFSNCGKPVVTESGWIRFPIASTNTYRIGAKQSTLSILCSTVLTANLKVGKQVGFGDAIRAPDFHRRDFAFVQQLVPRFGADSQGIAHLLDVHHIGILAQHHTVGIALVKSFAAYTKHLFFENLRI